MESANPERLLTVQEVTEQAGLAQSTVYRQIQRGCFPEPVRIDLKGGPRLISRWRQSEIQAWISEQIHASQCA